MNIKLISVTIFLGASIIAFSSWYYLTTAHEIQELNKRNEKLSIGLQTSQNTITRLQQQYIRAYELINHTNQEFSKIKDQNQSLRSIIQGENFGELAEKDPESIQTTINETTSEIQRCLELISGSSMTQEEINAKSLSQFNSNCSWIYQSIDDQRMFK